MAWINDGFPTTISFGNAPSGVTLYIQEREITPPGIDAGGENDTTTMRNTAWRTKQPKKLLSLTECSLVCKYDAAFFSQILTMVKVNTMIVIAFPDESTYRFRGWLDKFTPNAIVEGEMATANITVIPANQTAAGVEVAPVYQTGG